MALHAAQAQVMPDERMTIRTEQSDMALIDEPVAPCCAMHENGHPPADRLADLPQLCSTLLAITPVIRMHQEKESLGGISLRDVVNRTSPKFELRSRMKRE